MPLQPTFSPPPPTSHPTRALLSFHLCIRKLMILCLSLSPPFPLRPSFYFYDRLAAILSLFLSFVLSLFLSFFLRFLGSWRRGDSSFLSLFIFPSEIDNSFPFCSLVVKRDEYIYRIIDGIWFRRYHRRNEEDLDFLNIARENNFKNTVVSKFLKVQVMERLIYFGRSV